MNGVIWSKTQQTFVPISSVPIYAKMQEERLKRSRALETHNFQLQNLTLTSFEEPSFLDFYDNDTKISGLYGEIWSVLSESLNFTLQPMRANVDSLGITENFFKDGLLDIISRNETIAIPKLEMYSNRLVACDFAMPFWTNKYYLYIHTEVRHDDTWMFKIFSWRVWIVILMMYVLLSVCSFLTQNILIRTCRRKCNGKPFSEYLFDNYRCFCNQDYSSDYLLKVGSLKILEVSSGLFSSIISMAFGALMFTYLTKKVFVPPFHSLDSLISNTDYKIVTLTGSIGDLIFKVNISRYVRIRTSKRCVRVPTVEEMYKLACSKKEKYAIYEGEIEYKLRDCILCYLAPIGEPNSKIWMGSGIVKNFKYKRTVDLGIIRLMEFGLLNVLNNRWFGQKNRKPSFDDNVPQPIEIQQVSVIFAVVVFGAIIALVIFMIENIWFIYKIRHS